MVLSPKVKFPEGRVEASFDNILIPASTNNTSRHPSLIAAPECCNHSDVDRLPFSILVESLLIYRDVSAIFTYCF
jgi:hypothetical protein